MPRTRHAVKHCPSCLGTIRRGTGARALYRNGADVAIGRVCALCIRRSLPVVLGAVLHVEDAPKRRGAFVRSVLGLEPESK